MNIISLSLKKSAAVVTLAALFSFYYGPAAYAAPGDADVGPSLTGTVVQESNSDTTVITSFFPDLGLATGTLTHLTANASSSVAAYYGVNTTFATTTADAHYRIGVNHVTEALVGDEVMLDNVGFFDAAGHSTTAASYGLPTESSGNLTFDGAAMGALSAGDEFTNVEKITFAQDAPLGQYIISYSLVNVSASSTEQFGDSFNFAITLDAATSTGTTTPPTASSSTAVITVNGDNPTSVFSCNGYVDAGATARDSAVATSSASSTLAVNTSSNVNIEQAGTYTVVYTATDGEGNTATSTRIVTVLNCGSGGGSGGSGGSSRPADNASSNGGTSGSIFAGQVLGASFGFPGIPATGSFFFPFPGIPATAGVAIDSALNMLLTSNLTIGSRGAEVTALQTRLFQTGYFKGPITGYYGPLTRAAVRSFQKAHGVSATGFLGPLTRAIFNS